MRLREYLTINADGTMLGRAAASAIIGKFKGVETTIAGRLRPVTHQV